ncbi:nuclear transport factor 2 family protein [Erythrobacter crassostreae]|uniref:Nuclear transport factor 2 family protein n=1 Tax=Erythrobacter crassostreae TaxID=2828328 RepID=A0A9X1JNE2_9SPHN|nr:nuclear transport factor 2 family protein [Erythrobacter crassostrea]MBV7259628.1 nuclear transport factor 2 family protein [Erythrobacter crassostrea]
MTGTAEIAQQFVKLLIEEDDAGLQEYWSDDIVSLEPMEGEMARVEGRDALLAKHAWWNDNAEMHSVSTDGPYVFGDQFAVRFTMDVTMFGERTKSSEVGIYTLKDGKIVEERFLYGADE